MEQKIKNLHPSDENCPIRKTMGLLGGKGTLVILFQINERIIRFNELRRAIPGISEKVLIQELNNLVEHGLVSRKAYPVIPPKVEYSLTEIGKKTLPIMDTLASFGLENLMKA